LPTPPTLPKYLSLERVAYNQIRFGLLLQQSPSEGRGFNPAIENPTRSFYRLRCLTRASIRFALSANPHLKASQRRYFRSADVSPSISQWRGYLAVRASGYHRASAALFSAVI